MYLMHVAKYACMEGFMCHALMNHTHCIIVIFMPNAEIYILHDGVNYAALDLTGLICIELFHDYPLAL